MEAVMARKRRRKNGNGVETSLESLQEDLSALQADMSKVMAGLSSAASHGVSDAFRTASTRAEDVIEGVEALGQEGVNSVRSSIRSQPLVACAISVGAGALIGALLARQ
jgi:ElaB/YqjD/DUF883 family membrane-anchored ribosome-binding protein